MLNTALILAAAEEGHHVVNELPMDPMRVACPVLRCPSMPCPAAPCPWARTTRVLARPSDLLGCSLVEKVPKCHCLWCSVEASTT